MSYSLFHVLHLVSLFIFVGIVFAAVINPVPEQRKTMLMWSGITSMLVLIAGLGLLGITKVGFPMWVIVKLVCWFLIAGLVGMAYRMPDKRVMLIFLTVLLVLVSVLMVSLKPF